MNDGPRRPILRVIKKPPIDATDFFLMLQKKSRISALEVQQWFSKADCANRLKVPVLANCEAIAQILTEFKCLGPPPKVGPVRYQKTPDGAKIPEPELNPPRYHKAREHLLIARKHLMLAREGKPNKAEKYWRLARDYVTKEIEAHTHQIAGRPLTNYHAALAAGMESLFRLDRPLDNVNGAIDLANSLIDLWDVYPPPKWNWHGRALWVADMAQEAWRKTGGATPRDHGPDHSLCKFTTAALGASGFTMSHDAVSSALRERRGQRHPTKAEP